MKRLATALAAIILAAPGFGATWQYWYGLGDGVSLTDPNNWNLKLDGSGGTGSDLTADTILGFVDRGQTSVSLPASRTSNSIVVSGDCHVKLTVEPGKVLDCNGKNINVGYLSTNYLPESYPPNGSKDDGFDPDARPSLEFVGVVSNTVLRVGSNPDLNGAELTVSGPGSVLHSASMSVPFGIYKGGSTLSVTNGATFAIATSALLIGGNDSNPDAGANTFYAENATIEIPRGVTVGNKAGDNLMTVKSSTVKLNSDYTSSVGGAGSSRGNKLVVDNSTWGTRANATRQKFYVGKSGSDCNTLVVTNGASVFVSDFSCGYSGSSNRVEVSDGSFLWANGTMYLATSDGSDSNVMEVFGAGTVVSNSTSDVYVGRRGSNNRLAVRDGASFFAGKTLYLGKSEDAYVTTNNVIELSGTNAYLCVNDKLMTKDADNRVVVKDGAQLFITAQGSGSTGVSTGTVLGTGDGSVSNRIEVSNGGTLTVNSKCSLLIGSRKGSDGCALVVDGGKATFGTSTYVGNSACDGLLEFVNGAQCMFSQFYLGYGSASTGNRLHVAGEGTLVSNKTLNVYVGYAGKSCQALIEDGALFHVATDLCIAANKNTSGAASNSTVVVRNGGRLHVVGQGGSAATGILLSQNYSEKSYDPELQPQGVKMIVEGGEVECEDSIVMQYDTEFALRGSKGSVRTAQFRFANTAHLSWTSDREGFTPVKVAKTVKQTTAKCNFAKDGAYITVDATKFAFAGGGTRTLIESEADISTGYEASVNNGKITLIPEGTTLTLSQDRKKLMVTVPNKKGLCIILR